MHTLNCLQVALEIPNLIESISQDSKSYFRYAEGLRGLSWICYEVICGFFIEHQIHMLFHKLLCKLFHFRSSFPGSMRIEIGLLLE